MLSTPRVNLDVFNLHRLTGATPAARTGGERSDERERKRSKKDKKDKRDKRDKGDREGRDYQAEDGEVA